MNLLDTLPCLLLGFSFPDRHCLTFAEAQKQMQHLFNQLCQELEIPRNRFFQENLSRMTNSFFNSKKELRHFLRNISFSRNTEPHPTAKQ